MESKDRHTFKSKKIQSIEKLQNDMVAAFEEGNFAKLVCTYQKSPIEFEQNRGLWDLILSKLAGKDIGCTIEVEEFLMVMCKVNHPKTFELSLANWIGQQYPHFEVASRLFDSLLSSKDHLFDIRTELNFIYIRWILSLDAAKRPICFKLLDHTANRLSKGYTQENQFESLSEQIRTSISDFNEGDEKSNKRELFDYFDQSFQIIKEQTTSNHSKVFSIYKAALYKIDLFLKTKNIDAIKQVVREIDDPLVKLNLVSIVKYTAEADFLYEIIESIVISEKFSEDIMMSVFKSCAHILGKNSKTLKLSVSVFGSAVHSALEWFGVVGYLIKNVEPQPEISESLVFIVKKYFTASFCIVQNDPPIKERLVEYLTGFVNFLQKNYQKHLKELYLQRMMQTISKMAINFISVFSPVDKEKLRELFEHQLRFAVMDPGVWIEYIKFELYSGSGIEKLRKLFTRSISFFKGNRTKIVEFYNEILMSVPGIAIDMSNVSLQDAPQVVTEAKPKAHTGSRKFDKSNIGLCSAQVVEKVEEGQQNCEVLTKRENPPDQDQPVTVYIGNIDNQCDYDDIENLVRSLARYQHALHKSENPAQRYKKDGLHRLRLQDGCRDVHPGQPKKKSREREAVCHLQQEEINSH
jgi:hypothetical protein